MSHAPVALFVYKRLWHTQQTVESLLKNRLAVQTELTIFSDGPKDASAQKDVQEVRDWIESLSGFKKITIIKQDRNLGLAQSIINGVTELVNKYGKVIVVEDDLVVSQNFLEFMNDGLNVYQEDEKVASIHGYTFPIKQTLPTTYFLKGADCWGWATWKRAWDKFEPDGEKLLKLLREKKLCFEFDFDNTQPNIQMLKDQIKGKNNSWAIRWNASAFIHDMVTLYPGKSLVRNIGFDNTGMHCGVTNMYDVEVTQEPVVLERMTISKNPQVYKIYVNYFKSLSVPFYKKILRKTKNLLVS